MRKILGNRKAISTILAALLMVVIVVVASVMVYAWSTGLLGALMGTNPNVGQETLTLDQATMANSTTFVLNLRNQGQVAVTLTGYYVSNAGSTVSYQKLSGWAGPSIDVGQVGTAYIRLDNGGTWTPNTPFTFQTGFTYGVKLQTANTLLPEVTVPKQ